jgi:hypothetical protein
MAEKMLNYKLVTKQTKPGGVLVEKVRASSALLIHCADK